MRFAVHTQEGAHFPAQGVVAQIAVLGDVGKVTGGIAVLVQCGQLAYRAPSPVALLGAEAATYDVEHARSTIGIAGRQTNDL